ncbi:PQQ-dependent sugar dehydrogenase [Variovorax sp. OV329]|uniref:PQQ-dependent sugar dehydrogenase n=1 Tax=Variovorax sp. OV329 TaxID=1882825 RepID=UPI0008EC57B5|nr:PQQ-dependent sugar dehydrogenase [Variovorax sp. OV329]SFL92825.1 Glucose/arabinose dehydrogenase, beta-propeller fold [Variovorax sp. OV329]
MRPAKTWQLPLWLLLAAALSHCGGGGGSSTPAATPAAQGNTIAGTTTTGGTVGQPVTPATPGSVQLKLTELINNLSSPWGLAFLPDRRMLITERGGTLRLRQADGSMPAGGDSVSGVPAVLVAGQGGLLDVAVDPDFASNRRIYLSYSEGTTNSNGTAVARAVLDPDTRALSSVTVIFRQTPKVNSTAHFGSRLVFDRSGQLFVTMGERLLDDQRGFAQDLTRDNGKVMRITTDGGPAPGNPNQTPVPPTGTHIDSVWSYGHRNPQGAALNPATGELWVSEHGPQGGDEINRILPGHNYGWPIISYGQEYGTTTQVGEGTAKAGMDQPVTYWEMIDGSAWTTGQKSSIAPSGLAFYSADAIPQWKGSLFTGALAGTALWRMTLSGNVVTARERLLAERGERIRDVRQGPDGWLYLLTDASPNGKLLRYEAQ